MNIKFDKAVIMSGNDFKLTEQITLHHPTINDILSLNHGYRCESLYWNYIQVILCDPYANMVMLDDLGENFMEVTPFEVFQMQWDRYQRDYFKNKLSYDALGIHPTEFIVSALNFFITEKHNYSMVKCDDGHFCLCDMENTTCRIDETIFNYICEWLKCINKIDTSNRIRPADENARRILIEDTREEIKKKKRRKNHNDDDITYIGNLMSAISFGGNGTITPFNVKECKIYWIFEAQSIENKKSHANHILDGLYHGTIQSQNINKRELDWIS